MTKELEDLLPKLLLAVRDNNSNPDNEKVSEIIFDINDDIISMHIGTVPLEENTIILEN